MGADKLIPRITGQAHDSRIGKRISKLCGEIFRRDHLFDVKPFRGVHALIEELLLRGIRIAIASSADNRERALLLEIAQVADLLEENSRIAKARRSKPDPEIVSAALKKLGLPSGAVLMVGDTPYDIQAAAMAGIRTVAFRCGRGWNDRDLMGALVIHNGPWSFLHSLQKTSWFSAEQIARTANDRRLPSRAKGR